MYYSTNGKAPLATLEEAVVKGLAGDRGLYMPEKIKRLPREFYDNIADMSFHEIAIKVADAFFGEDIEREALEKIVRDTLSFDCPVVRVTDSIYSLELSRTHSCVQGCGSKIHGTASSVFHKERKQKRSECTCGNKR